MPSQKELLGKIKEEVSRACAMIKEKNLGANLEEAKRLLNEIQVAFDKNNLDVALSLAQQAQLAARPTTEYLLGRAKNLESQGSAAYAKQDFSFALKFWQDSIKELKHVRELAYQRGEQEIVDSVTAAATSIEENIQKANTARTNLEMRNLVSEANHLVSDARSLYDSGKFDEASEKFKIALEKYSSAVNIASESKVEDSAKLKNAVMDMQNSIEACYFGKAGGILDTAMQENAEEKERTCLEVVKFLKSHSSTDPEHADLTKKAQAGIAQARIEVGKNLIDKAQDLYDQRDYYKAKECFRKAQEHFNKVSDFTVTQRLEKENAEIDSLIDTCTASIKACTNNLIGAVSSVDIPEPQSPFDLPRGIVRKPPIIEPSDRERMAQLGKELKDEYGEIKWLKPGGVNYIALAQNNAGSPVILRLPKKLDASTRRSFLQQWEEWKNLKQHRNIVTLIEANISPPLLVLEYVDGGSLTDYLKRTRVVDIKIACRIINDIARGLDYAHSKNAIHGDLKPNNILLTTRGEAKITDWSLGKSFTPSYAAPEQFERQMASEKTDVYQLGLVFYEMVSGGNPCAHGSIVEMENIAKTWNPDKLSAHSANLESLDDVALRCLAKDPNKRPTIREFRKDIYIYLKVHHGESLSISTDIKTQITELSDLAVLAAKQNEPEDLQDTLKSLLFKLPEELRKQLIQESAPKMSHINIVYNTYHDSVVQVKANPTIPQQDVIVNETETLVREASGRLVGYGRA